MRQGSLLMLGGGANPGGFANQNMAQWAAPFLVAGIGDAGAVGVFPNHALGKTFYTVLDNDAVNFEARGDPSTVTMKNGERWFASCLVDTANSSSTDGVVTPLYVTDAAYSQALCLNVTLATKATAFQGLGGRLTGAVKNATLVDGNIYLCSMEFTVGVGADLTMKLQAFGAGVNAGANQGTLYVAEPVLRKIS